MNKNTKSLKDVSAFTLIELILVIVIVALLIPSIFIMYEFLIRSNREIHARQDTIQQWYEFFEKLNILLQDYTVDYEEYYNRQMVWCTPTGLTWSNFTRNIWLSWYCTNFSAYGNENSTNRKVNFSNLSWQYRDVYYCSSAEPNKAKIPQKSKNVPVVVGSNHCWKIWSKQSFGQYANLFIDVHGDTDLQSDSWYGSFVWDSDDENLWRSNIDAIQDSNNIQELYFISHDWKSRLFFRRKLIHIDETVNNGGYYTQYKIQMLRLRWFDAGQKHSFEITDDNLWLYDWVIDTWACDSWMWFEWHGTDVWWAYSGYKLPLDVDDCWVDLTHGATTVSVWNMWISPVTDSELSWADQTRQINAYMKILTVNGIYPPYYKGRMSSSIADFKVPLQTTINMKDFYRN